MTNEIRKISYEIGFQFKNGLLEKKNKKKSPVIAVSTDGKPLELPVVRGGARLKEMSLVSREIKSKKLATLIRAIITAKRSQKLYMNRLLKKLQSNDFKLLKIT